MWGIYDWRRKRAAVQPSQAKAGNATYYKSIHSVTTNNNKIVRHRRRRIDLNLNVRILWKRRKQHLKTRQLGAIGFKVFFNPIRYEAKMED